MIRMKALENLEWAYYFEEFDDKEVRFQLLKDVEYLVLRDFATIYNKNLEPCIIPKDEFDRLLKEGFIKEE